MNNFVTIDSIIDSDNGALTTLYRDVFQGYPWYEDKVCSGVLLPESDPTRCTVQYTQKKIPGDYLWKLNIKTRSGVVGEVDFERTKKCALCQKPLIYFYPDFVNQRILIEEAHQQTDFIGFVARENVQGDIVGFCWGYQIPKERTRSVDFPRALPLLAELSIERTKSFYWAEVGVVEEYQGRGIGGALSRSLFERIKIRKYEWLTLRTKNETVKKILRKTLCSTPLEERFNDPERGTPWYALNLGMMDTKKFAPGTSRILY